MARSRRHRGEGSIYQHHTTSAGCPPVDPDTGERPAHDCTARWVQAVDLGMIGGKRVRKTVSANTKRELQAKARQLRQQLDAGVLPDQATVGEWLDHWADKIAPRTGTIRPPTLAGYRGYIRRYIKPAVGHIPLQQLRPEHVEGMIDWMGTLRRTRNPGKGEPLSPTTIRQAVKILQSALSDAVQRERVVRNVAAIVKAPAPADHPHEMLNLDEAKRVLAGARTVEELARLTCALALGIRQGEALALRWSDYRTVEGVPSLVVEEGIARVGGKLTRGDVKSRASHRAIPLPPAVAAILDQLQLEATGDYIFPGVDGGPLDAKRDWSRWAAALKRAGVLHVPLHGARRSAASLLAEMGVPDWQVAQILGHGSVQVTRRHYIEGQQESHRAALGGLVGQILPKAAPH